MGGDAYLAYPLEDGGILAGVADVSGHGLSSALLMNGFATALSALVREVDDPSHLLAVVNDLIVERVGEMGMFITATLLRVRRSEPAVLAIAGHPPAALVSAGGEVSSSRPRGCR